jgi:uncharacterized protein YllA (UPF0747 family)
MLLPACRTALDDQRTALAKVLTCYVHELHTTKKERRLTRLAGPAA